MSRVRRLYEKLSSGRFEPVASPAAPGDDADEATTPRDGRAPAGSGRARIEPPGGPLPLRGIALPAPSPAADGGWVQFAVVGRRSMLLTVRDRGLVLAMLAQPAALGALVALAQYDAPGPFPILFFAAVVATWLG